MNPYPVGTVVHYHGSHTHGLYVITEHQEDLEDLFTEEELDLIAEQYPRGGLAERYPDAVAYVIWKEGVERKFGNRMHSVYRVRRESITPVERQGS